MPGIMSDKPRVYQGVRVKTTVKELLQRHRAREANRKTLKTISQACLELQDLCASTLPNFIPSAARYADPAPPPLPPPPPPPPHPHTSSSSSSSIMELSSYNNHNNNHHHSLLPVHGAGGDAFTDIQQQFGDVMLPSNCYNNISNNLGGGGGGGGIGGYSGAQLPPPPALPLPWCHGLSSDADFYGTGMAPCSSPESLKLCSPVDHNSYSPQDSFSSSSSSSCYDSPTRMESSSGFSSGFSSSSDPYPPHHYPPQCSSSGSLQDCFSLSHCWPLQQQQDAYAAVAAAAAAAAPEHYGYYGPSDFGYGCQEENNLLRSSEMCYNVL